MSEKKFVLYNSFIILFNIVSVYSLSFSTSPNRIIVSGDTRLFPLTTILLTNSALTAEKNISIITSGKSSFFIDQILHLKG